MGKSRLVFEKRLFSYRPNPMPDIFNLNIIMLSTARIKLFKSYQQKKFRRQDNVFVAETPKVAEVFLQGDIPIRTIAATQDWWNDILNRNAVRQWEWRHGRAVEKIEISHKELERISGLVTPQEVWMLLNLPGPDLPKAEDLYADCNLVLDNLRDPGNIGTIIRIADWFGIDRILCTDTCADVFQPKCVQASMGSAGTVPVHYIERSDLLALIRNKPDRTHIYGTFLQGENIYRTKLPTSHAWYLIGNEAHGIDADLEQHVQTRLSIPSAPKHTTGAESLNAAIATAILCSEIRRNG